MSLVRAVPLAGAALIALGLSSAAAQDIPEITVTPLDDRFGGQGYVGPYGRDLPGVAMFRGRDLAVTPDFFNGGVPLPSRQKVTNEYTFDDPLPVLDGWQGTLGPGFPF